jgi:hypothetical protein
VRGEAYTGFFGGGGGGKIRERDHLGKPDEGWRILISGIRGFGLDRAGSG